MYANKTEYDEYMVNYNEKNRDRLLKNKRDWYHKHKETVKLKQHEAYLKRKESGVHNQKQHEYREKLKKEVFFHYSNGLMCCEVCRENRLDCLNLHHKNFDGAEHRKNKDVISGTYQWAKKNNYPNIFRVLCYNCNIFLQRQHQREETQ